jgi:hypothetical protein
MHTNMRTPFITSASSLLIILYSNAIGIISHGILSHITHNILKFYCKTLLHKLYSSPDIVRQIKSRRMRWAGHVARMGEGRNVYRVLMGKSEGKRPLERPRRRWEDGIKMGLREICWGVRSGLTWLRIGTVGGLL